MRQARAPTCGAGLARVQMSENDAKQGLPKGSARASDTSMRRKLPVMLLSGFLGAGKTTLLKHILTNTVNMRVAVLVNDMATLNIDASLVARHAAPLQAAPQLVEMQNGCICCTLREDLLIEVRKLADAGRFDYLVIESTGISEPMQVAETFSISALDFGIALEEDTKRTEQERKAKAGQEGGATGSGQSSGSAGSEAAESSETSSRNAQTSLLEVLKKGALSKVATLDACVTVVDCSAFFDYLGTQDTLHDRWKETPEEDERDISALMVDQVEFANIILLNKCDLADKKLQDRVAALVQKLNPKAKVFRTTNATIDVKELLNTKLFSYEDASTSAGWLQSLRSNAVSETEEYGISSFIYRRRRPFHGQRLAKLLQKRDFWKDLSIYRSKGFVWITVDHDTMFDWTIAGASMTLDPSGAWLSALDEEVLAQLKDNLPKKERDRVENVMKDQKYGDRRQEIVLIGKHTAKNEKNISKVLDECLLTDEEFALGPSKWASWSCDIFAGEEGGEQELGDKKE